LQTQESSKYFEFLVTAPLYSNRQRYNLHEADSGFPNYFVVVPAKNMKTENHFFESLDACFIGIDQTSNDPLLWKCAGMQIQQRFELPIPSLAGSVCKYSFSTTIGDIAFSVEYRCKGRPDEKIFGNSRVPSDLEPISGTFKSVREGTLLFIFDNSFSWYNPKILTYKIELFQVRYVLKYSCSPI
jgi:hypothetical protein